jgi:aromatic-L-amino-acid decarboxylase
MALKFMGRQGYAQTVERQIDLTNYLASKLDRLPGFKRLGQVETAVCCFRYLPDSLAQSSGVEQDRMQQRLQQTIERSGEAWLTTTVLHGRRALRVNINSFLTEQRHVDVLLSLLERASSTI